MVDDSRSIVLQAFERIELIINQRMTLCFTIQTVIECTIINNTSNTARIQWISIITNLVFSCNQFTSTTGMKKVHFFFFFRLS